MTRGDLSRLVVEFSERGGTVICAREGTVTVDWSESRFRKLARAVGASGHRKRKLGKWITRRGQVENRSGK